MNVGQYLISFWQTLQTGVMNAVANLAITDVIDMAIIAFLLYKLMGFLRRSRLGMVAKSLLILAAVVWISGRFNLLTINFLTRNALELGILALVILFQPEIRQILERVGRSNFSDFFNTRTDEQEMEKIIVQVVLAAVQMSRERVGALLVFERKVSVSDEAKTGTQLDARLSSELLKNIFYDKAPLHDGAVIIRGGRIVSAGCMLPLSNNEHLSRDLGMRHRAGIGISEKSDAIAVIVSEETGSISVAVEGMLKRHLQQDTFEKLLRNELILDMVERKNENRGLFSKFKKGRKSK